MFTSSNRLQAFFRRAALPLLVWLMLHALLVLPVPRWAQGSAALALLLFPGALLALLLFGDERSVLTRTWLALCGGVALLPPLMLALHVLPGPFPATLLLVVCDALALLHGALLLRGQAAGGRSAWQSLRHPITLSPCHLVIAAVLLVGVALRFPNLGTSEMQGDESRALLMATGLMYGQDDMLLVHKKGPVEILLPAGPFALTGTISEGVARLPFLLAGVGVLMGAIVLGRALFRAPDAQGGESIALLAGSILALDGFLIGFARIVQYQSIVLLLSSAALWCAWRFATDDRAGQRYLVGAVWCAAVALLAHWDAVFALPALAWLVGAGVWRRGWSIGAAARTLALPMLVGGGLAASFFVPFVLNERFQATLGYLDARLQTEGDNLFPFNNLPGYFAIATFYNTTFQIGALAAALLGGLLAWLWLYVRSRWVGGALLALLGAGAALMLVAPAAFALPSGASWAVVPFALPLLALIAARATPFALRTLLIWFGTTFIAEGFLVSNPRTHFYSMNVPAALLAAAATVRLWLWLRERRFAWLRAPLALGGAALVLLALPYLYIAFLRQHPSYALVFPDARPALYRATYGDELPAGGAFGFPHRSGWKAIGALYQQGVLQGSYNSNEEEIITGWYLRGAYRCADDPDYYFIATTPNDPVKLSRKKFEKYNLLGSVQIDGASDLQIYSRAAFAQPRSFDIDSYSRQFDAAPATNFPLLRPLGELVPQYRSTATWQDGLRLRGYDLDRERLVFGQKATIALYWQVTTALEGNYQVVFQVLDQAGNPIDKTAKAYCGVMPPEDWDAGEVNSSTFQIAADALPSGTYTLRVGLRERKTGAWLPLAGGAQMLDLRQITVERS